MRANRRQPGFTLIELLVVLAIMVILAALTVPVGRSMMESSRVNMCASNLQRLGRALKMYHMDYQGVPPVRLAENGADPTTPYDEMLDPATEPLDNALMLLWRDGYLRDREALHCPRDRAGPSSNPAYYESYTGRQPDDTPEENLVKIAYLNDHDSGDAWNGLEIAVNRFKYMPNRIFKVRPDPHTWDRRPSSYHRQLAERMQPVLVAGEVAYWIPAADPTWMPHDTTIVTWCDKHADTWTVEKVGQYQVLWWDGSATLKKRTLFERGTSTDPSPAAWEVGRHD